MQFYNIGDNSFSSRGWTWAMSLQPRLKKHVKLCDACGNIRDKETLYPRVYPELPLAAEVEGGRKYPDILGCGAGSLLIVSEAVIDDWEANNVTGYEKFPLNVAKATGSRIQAITPPQYYHIKVTGRCELDLEAMGIRMVCRCPKCGYSSEELLFEDPESEDYDPFESFNFVFREETWDGSDLFVSDLFPCVPFCTQKVVDLAGIYKRTNFCFVPSDKMRGPTLHRGIDYVAAARQKVRTLLQTASTRAK